MIQPETLSEGLEPPVQALSLIGLLVTDGQRQLDFLAAGGQKPNGTTRRRSQPARQTGLSRIGDGDEERFTLRSHHDRAVAACDVRW
jgi:hypothetical protein